MVNYKKVKVHGGGNGLGVELDSKNSKPQSREIKVIVCANKVACPLMEKSNFVRRNS
jgi:hypothetical protein